MPLLEAFHLCAPEVDEQRRIATRLKAQLAEVKTARLAAIAQLREVEALPAMVLGQSFKS